MDLGVADVLMRATGVYVLTYGVLSDITTPAERGGYSGVVSFGFIAFLCLINILIRICSVNTAPSLGPVFGSILNSGAGWRWVFWFLAILSGLVLGLIFLTLPETARAVVGNGIVPTHGIHKVPARFMRGKFDPEDQDEILTRKRRWTVPNPLACLKIAFRKDSAIILAAFGM